MKVAKIHLTGNQVISRSVAVSVHPGCYYKNTINWVAYNKRFSQFWRLGGPRLWQQQMWCLVRARLAPRAEGARKLSLAFFFRALIPFIRALPLWPNHLLLPSHWRLGFQHKNLGGTNFQTIAVALLTMRSAHWVSMQAVWSTGLIFLFFFNSIINLLGISKFLHQSNLSEIKYWKEKCSYSTK